MSLTYPRHVHQRGGVYRIVQDAAEHAAAAADGWVDHPLLEWGPAEDGYREWDGQPLDDREPVKKPKRGRPRQTEPDA